METTRFETFIDAIIAIIITVLILKIQQPAEPTLSAIWDLRVSYLAYLISFLTLFNIWYNNHNLFQKIDNIDNSVVWIYGIMTFIISLVPYFTMWVARNVDSLPAETMFGLLFVCTNILYIISIKAIYRSNPYNKFLQETDKKTFYQLSPLLIIIIGFILTYTVYRPGIYISCLIAVLIWICVGWRAGNGD
ncbi:TMEM175 family protein [Methanobrevibacter sp.]|uniref:TMEM175 family protein n=1 Tax=Methanobrevibacter sp. TaxID=66852 RepID=UPI00388E9198